MSKYSSSAGSSEIIGASIYTLKNNRGTKVKVMNFGATVLSQYFTGFAKPSRIPFNPLETE